MIKNIFGKIRNMFTTANVENNGTTANVENNNGQTTTDGTTPVKLDPVKLGTTPELRDGQGVVSPERPLSREDLNEQLADELATCKYFVKLYTERLADTTDELSTTTVRDRLTFWQNERDGLNDRLAELTDDERQTVGQLFTSKLAVLTDNNDPDTAERQDVKSATFALNAAKKRCDEQREVVKSANDDAKSARDNATAQRDQLNKQRVNVSRLAVQSGTATADDVSLLARQDVTDDAADVVSSVAKKLFAKRQNGNKLLRQATDKLRSLSNIVKNLKKNFADFVPFFNCYEVPFTADDVTVKVVKSENVHPFMLVPTADGLKVCDPVTVGRSLSPLTRWNEEKYCQLVVLNHYMKLENVSDERINLHVALLSSAVVALQNARDKKNAASLTNDRIKELNDRLAVLADPDKTPDAKFDVSLFVQLTNELADEKNKLREQLAAKRQAEKLANDKKSDVLNDKKSDDVTTTVNNARSERDNANNGQTANVENNDGQTNVQTPTTPVQTDNGTTANVPDVQTVTTPTTPVLANVENDGQSDVQTPTTPTTRRRSGNGTKNGTTASRSRSRQTASQTANNGTKNGSRSRNNKKVVNA